MNRLWYDVEERQMADLLDRMSSINNFWAKGKPTEEIDFQRFAVELHEEDFEQESVKSGGFLVRGRTADRIAKSGSSVVTNDARGFKVLLDVWPFKMDELQVYVVPGKYFRVAGEHEKRAEDNSECARQFQRYYSLPTGVSGNDMQCSYHNFRLTVRADKKAVDKLKAERIVYITRDTFRNGQGVQTGEQCIPATEGRDVPITIVDAKNDNDAATEIPRVVPIVEREPKSDNDAATEIPRVVPIVGEPKSDNDAATEIPRVVPIVEGGPESDDDRSVEKSVESLKALVRDKDTADVIKVAQKVEDIEDAVHRKNSKRAEAVKNATESSVKIPIASEIREIDIQVEEIDDNKKVL